MTDQQPLPAETSVSDSPHRHISFTAHYTGYIWFQEGISHPALASRKGHFFAGLMAPFESLAEHTIGDSMRTTLRQRHTLIDRRLDHWLAQYPDAQILEIAAGLSPRGWRYRQAHPGLTYVEADLPAMAAAKRQALAGLENPPPRIEGVDLFSEEFTALLDSFDAARPLIIISEGLINYFSKAMLHELWTVLASGLARFTQGIYLTDLYPEPVTRRLAKVIWQSSKLLRYFSRSAFAFHFISPREVETALHAAGFVSVDVMQPHSALPADSKQQLSHAAVIATASSDPDVHQGDLVWVIEART